MAITVKVHCTDRHQGRQGHRLKLHLCQASKSQWNIQLDIALASTQTGSC